MSYIHFVPQTVAQQEATLLRHFPEINLDRPESIAPQDSNRLVIPEYVEMAHYCDPESPLRSSKHIYGRACLGVLAALQASRGDIEIAFDEKDVMENLSVSDATLDAYAMCQIKFPHAWYLRYEWLSLDSFKFSHDEFASHKFALGMYEMLVMLLTHNTVGIRSSQLVIVSHSVCLHDEADCYQLVINRQSFISKTLIGFLEVTAEPSPCIVPIAHLPRG